GHLTSLWLDWVARLNRWIGSPTMAAPLISEILPDLLEEIIFVVRQTDAAGIEEQLRALRIESICDCGDENCASFATAPEVKVSRVVELQAMEGFLIIDLNAAGEICFIEVLGRPDVKYLLEEHYAPPAENYDQSRRGDYAVGARIKGREVGFLDWPANQC